MSEGVSELQDQIEQLHYQREKNTLEQQNLKQQIDILLADNRVLHMQLNNIIHDSKISVAKSSDIFSENEVVPYKYQYQSKIKKEEKVESSISDHESQKIRYETELIRKDRQITRLQALVDTLQSKSRSTIGKGKEQQYKDKIKDLEVQILELRRQNQKLCQVNDKVISNFTDLRESFEEFQERKQSEGNVKQLESQIQYLTNELQNIININHSLNDRLKNKNRQSNFTDDNEVTRLKQLLYEKQQQFTQKQLEWEEEFNQLYSQISQLKGRVTNKKFVKRSSHSDAIKFQDHESRVNTVSVNQSLKQPEMLPTLSRPPRPYKNKNSRSEFESSKQQSRSEVQTLIHLTNKLEDQLKVSENIHQQLVNNIKVNTPRVESEYIRNTLPYQNVDEETYYRWVSLQDRIKYLREQNEALRRYPHQSHQPHRPYMPHY